MQALVDRPHVVDLVCVGKMPTVPGQNELNAMKRCNRQVSSIPCRIRGHESVPYVGLDDVLKTAGLIQHLDPVEEGLCLGGLRGRCAEKLGNHEVGSYQFIFFPVSLPPEFGLRTSVS
jgi:hypothetical protein